MSYSSDAKNEICQYPLESSTEALLELAGLGRLCGRYEDGEEIIFRFISESECVLDRVQKLIFFLYQVEGEKEDFENQHAEKKIAAIILKEEVMHQFFEETFQDLDGSFLTSKQRLLSRLEKPSHAKAYLRGAFLGGGSIVDPMKSYHLELVAQGLEDVLLIEYVFSILGIPVKTMKRRDQYVLYLKDSASIADLLVDLGAMKAMLALENAKAMKDIRNDMNRKVNAETANIDKQITAAAKQIQAIQAALKKGRLDRLPKHLQEIAKLRCAYPSLSLAKLGEKLEPPLSKSGVSHRIRKLMELLENIEHN